MHQTETDFCVVGGGPAGLTAALLLLRSGAGVTLLERSRTLDREYRGEILQPGALALLDQLGVLEGARDRGAYELTRFQLIERGKPSLDIDYRALPGPYNYLLSLPQRHLLAELLLRCEKYERFENLAGHRANGLVIDDGRIRGVVTNADHTVLAHCVLGADGRYSKVRRLAGIEEHRQDVFDLDVLWFKIPVGDLPVPHARIFRGDGNPVLAYKAFPGNLQLGWTLPHGRYRDIAARGIDHVRTAIAAVVPGYADLVREHLNDLSDLTLLDVFAAEADRWVEDGLMLIGDSAHTHSPLGAQGINLAIQDAVVAHPILIDSLRRRDFSATLLDRFPRRRGPDIAAVRRTQVMQSKGMLSSSRFGAFVRPKAMKVMRRTPVFRRITRGIAFGNPSIRVATELFHTDQR
ncbi:FAD-dependent monooxygenase [Nocardia arthritidis]|uniref:FAD-binding monooxygenase n=1 Tax=Nocardia arthritidis TaxID=228602 RepID=A0A6G9Y9Y4_9NOCA|nr:FAD-dependent monooxygenase [Nocardia arthritidis]QIS10039.1 FAD-binding monooxygenase [Nocardia arthritidis]